MPTPLCARRFTALDCQQRSGRGFRVFNYYRWRGWLDETSPLRRQLQQVEELARTFADNPKAFDSADLIARVLPSWVGHLMPVTPELARELQREPRLWLRARPGQGDELARRLGNSELHARVPDALWYRGDEDLYRTPEFHQGAFEIQDLSSQLVGHICAPCAGEKWWDACAGEGGKTLHLCDLMRNKGIVWASDPATWRLEVLRRRASRAKLFNYRAVPWQSSEPLPRGSQMRWCACGRSLQRHWDLGSEPARPLDHRTFGSRTPLGN